MPIVMPITFSSSSTTPLTWLTSFLITLFMPCSPHLLLITPKPLFFIPISSSLHSSLSLYPISHSTNFQLISTLPISVPTTQLISPFLVPISYNLSILISPSPSIPPTYSSPITSHRLIHQQHLTFFPGIRQTHHSPLNHVHGVCCAWLPLSPFHLFIPITILIHYLSYQFSTSSLAFCHPLYLHAHISYPHIYIPIISTVKPASPANFLHVQYLKMMLP